MTPADLRARRISLGLTAGGFARMLGMTGAECDRTVRRWERGDRAIPETVQLILELVDTFPEVHDRLMRRAHQQ